jgi:hypothetical protein
MYRAFTDAQDVLDSLPDGYCNDDYLHNYNRDLASMVLLEREYNRTLELQRNFHILVRGLEISDNPIERQVGIELRQILNITPTTREQMEINNLNINRVVL